MLHAKINQNTHDVQWNKDRTGGTLNGVDFSVERTELGGGKSRLRMNNRTFDVDIVRADRDTKTLVLAVNGHKYTVQVKDRYDDLLASLGMEDTSAKKVKSIKAPMSGLVLQINFNEGDVVEKDAPLVILEAMKMENVIKSPGEGTIKKIGVNKGQAVEKGALLVEFA